MSDYTAAPACQKLATNCVCCGKPLVDAVSCEIGMGPVCRDGIYPAGVDEAARKLANEHVFHAALAADAGRVNEVLSRADAIQKLGMPALAEKVRFRFTVLQQEVNRRGADITVKPFGTDCYLVKTPFRRKASDEFIKAWRAIPGRYYRGNGYNLVPVAQKAQLWALLKRFFPGKWGNGEKGLFRIPADPQLNLKLQQVTA